MTASISPSHPCTQHPLRQWHRAQWQDYVALRDAPGRERMKLAFNQGWLWVDRGDEGIEPTEVGVMGGEGISVLAGRATPAD